MLYIGIHGHVLALHPATGEEIWRTKIGGEFVNVVLQAGALYVTSSGEISRLDPATGNILWHNRLKGLGVGIVTIASAGDEQAVLSQDKNTRDQADATGAIISTM